MEIRRQGETTSLVVRLVTKPVTFTRPRTHCLRADGHAGQADARAARELPPLVARRAEREDGERGQLGFAWVRVTIGARRRRATHSGRRSRTSAFTTSLPRLRQGGAVDPKFVDKWLAQFTPEDLRLAQGSPEGAKPDLPTYRAHVNWSINFFSSVRPRPEIGQTLYVLPYTNARGVSCGRRSSHLHG